VPVTPAWQAPTSGQQANAGAVNQLLGTHAITYVWSGVLAASSTAGSGTVSSLGTWLAQKFTTAAGQTAAGYVTVTIGLSGSPATGPWTFSLQANSGSAPSGTALVSAAVPKEFLSSGTAAQQVMLPVTGLTAAATYWIVAQSAGSSGNVFQWLKSTAGTGASTSTNGTSWTAQAYGLTYQVYDQAAVLPLQGTWEDSGARWTDLTWSSGQLTGIEEYTAGQTAAGYTAASRTLSYSSAGLLTGVA